MSKPKAKTKVTMSYSSFQITTSDPSIFGGKCFLCGAKLEANVQHKCENGVPK